MEPPKKDETTDNGPQAQQQTSDQLPRPKLRDLKPEKDPMGAGDKSPLSSSGLD